jgi:hypothetical protein
MPTVSQRPLLISGRKSVHHRGRVEDHHRVCGHTSSNSEGKTGAAGGGRAGHPVVYRMDYNFFRQLTSNGDLANINRSKDGRFHVVGDLMVTPFSLLRDMLAELNRIVEACGTRPVMILEAVPRFLIRSCCINMEHCSNIRGADPASPGHLQEGHGGPGHPQLESGRATSGGQRHRRHPVERTVLSSTTWTPSTRCGARTRSTATRSRTPRLRSACWISLTRFCQSLTCGTTSSLGRGHWMPLLISTLEGRPRTRAASASAREAPTAAAAPAPTGSKTATATTSPAGTTRLTSTDPKGISPHFPHIQKTSVPVATPLPTAPGGAAAVAALIQNKVIGGWPGPTSYTTVSQNPAGTAGGWSLVIHLCKYFVILFLQ